MNHFDYTPSLFDENPPPPGSNQPVPDWARNTWGSTRAASDLVSVAEEVIVAWVGDGRLRTERRQGRTVVRLDEVWRLAMGEREATGGAS